MNKDSKQQQKVRRALGRGLTNLIRVDNEEEGSGNDVAMVDINVIAVNPFQPRTHFAQEEIDGLASSIAAQGLLQPIVVRSKVDGYEVVSGERRLRALRQLGWDKIPCIVKPKVSDREMLELALVENIQRENLNDIELAHAYQKLIAECGISQEDLSKRVGKSRSTISNTMRLLRLPAELQAMIRNGALSAGHARALLAIDDPQRQKELAERILSSGLTVRDIEAEVQNQDGRKDAGKAKNGKKPPSTETDPDMVQVLEQLQYRFGTAVTVRRLGKDRGRVEIQFHSNDDLTRILDLLLAK